MSNKSTKMAKLFAQSNSPRTTPQNQPIAGREGEMIQSASGGYTFKVSDLDRVRRFLILGSDTNTYYAKSEDLTLDNARHIHDMILSGHGADIARLCHIVTTSYYDKDAERYVPASAPRKSIALFVLAMVKVFATNDADRVAVHNTIRSGSVVSTLANLYEFLNNVYVLNGNQIAAGSGFKQAVADWMMDRKPRNLAMQIAKYRKRTFNNGDWRNKESHVITSRDVMRLFHPTAIRGSDFDNLFAWATKREDMSSRELADQLSSVGVQNESLALMYASAFEEAQATDSARRIVELIHNHGLTWEMIPNTWFGDSNKRDRKQIMRALLGLKAFDIVPQGDVWGMPLTALIRNLPRFGAYGLLDDMDVVNLIVDTLSGDGALERLTKARVHPIRILSALRGFASGKSRSGLRWQINNAVLDALEEAFYLSFGTLEPMFAGTDLEEDARIGVFDCSASMDWPENEIASVPGLRARAAAGVMSLALAHSERHYDIFGFTSSWGGDDGLKRLNVRKGDRIQAVEAELNNQRGGGTDTSLPFEFGLKNNVKYDLIMILTDNESWAGWRHTSEAQEAYRAKVNPNVKVVYVGFTATQSTVRDLNDEHSIEIVGFDATAPQIIADFVRGNL